MTVRTRNQIKEEVEAAEKEAHKNLIKKSKEVGLLQRVTELVLSGLEFESLLKQILEILEQELEFRHSSILVPDDTGAFLVTVASRGFENSGIGSVVPMGIGPIGAVAKNKCMVRIEDVQHMTIYTNTLRNAADPDDLQPTPNLPGLKDSMGIMAFPLLLEKELAGVFAVESDEMAFFSDCDEKLLGIVSNQIALAIHKNRLLKKERSYLKKIESLSHKSLAAASENKDKSEIRMEFYRAQEVVFINGKQFIKNIPALIFMKVIGEYLLNPDREFSKKEIRLDKSLGLPTGRDNLDSRLILLDKRLQEHFPRIQMIKTRRGMFKLNVDGLLNVMDK